MSDISLTAASVLSGSTGNMDKSANAGETITAGQAVYKSAAGKWMKADCNSATALARVATGFALNSASLDQPLAVQKDGQITIGGTLTPGVAYYLSANAGGICPVADLSTGMYPCLVGMALSSTILDIDFQPAGVAL